jgi:DNA (cytosine-5)-methyltransferase 1
MREKIRLAELFCGAGGIGLGASLAEVDGLEFEHVWATDVDKYACETYASNLNPKKVIKKDIRDIVFEEIKNEFGNVDCLTFGFPCNDFSSVGEHKGLHGEFGALYEYCAKALNVFNPKYFIAENVSGLRNANEGDALRRILNAFECAGAGYRIYPNLYKFEKYGIPQKRHRVIIVGIRKDVDVRFGVPSPEPYKDVDVSVKTALSDIPEDAPNNDRTKQSPVVVQRLKYIKEGENAFSADLPKELRLNVKGATISQIYKRLKADEPAYTITGSGGGGTHVYHFEEHRALTNRERARLQTFPNYYKFCGSKESVRRQIGMAVPPKGIKIILEALLDSIKGNNYKTIEGRM